VKESTIVRNIIKKMKERYPRAYVRKIADRYTRGMPDILIVVYCSGPLGELDKNGSRSAKLFAGILFVETKTKTGKASKLQEVELKHIQENGGEAILARDAESVLAKLEEMGAL
jgi:hypothetical protein